jgi:hypothetical protein
LEIDKTDSHIPTATTTAGNIFFPKGQKPACPKNTRLQAHSSIGKDFRTLVQRKMSLKVGVDSNAR